MDETLPQIEILPNQATFNHPELPRKPWYKIRRLFVFTLIFVLSATVSLGYVYSRPALFRSYATLLTVAQTAIDQFSNDADTQHVAIQSQVLIGQVLLDETLVRLNQSQLKNISKEGQLFLTELPAARLRNMLTVQAVPETNLVELAATGYQAEVLAPLINIWIDVYLERRADEIRQTTGLTLEVLQEELYGLEAKIILKRTELNDFRKENEIISLGRENIFENQSLAHYRGLNQSLSIASDEAIKAKARLDAINRAIASGETVVPDNDKQMLHALELRLQKLRTQLAGLDEKYTRQYLALQPESNLLPQQIKELEQQIQIKRNEGKGIALSDAEQNYDIAQQTLHEIKKQLELHKQLATEFSSKFSEHEALLSDLEGLELLEREAQERLTQIEAKQMEKFPQVNVIERAFIPGESFSPDYTRDAAIAIGSSIILGLFGVWLVDFLTRKEEQTTTIKVTGSRYYQDIAPDLISRYQQRHEQLNQSAYQAIPQDQSYKLEQNLFREVSINEVNSLFEAADINAKQLIALLLSGLSAAEIIGLTYEDFDFENNRINITGDKHRSISFGVAIKNLFKNITPCPVWNKGQKIEMETLESVLVYAIVDAGLSEAELISLDSIAYTYVLYLVKQGVRLSELEKIIGYIEPKALSQYSRFSPNKKGVSMTDINLLYPALEKYLD